MSLIGTTHWPHQMLSHVDIKVDSEHVSISPVGSASLACPQAIPTHAFNACSAPPTRTPTLTRQVLTGNIGPAPLRQLKRLRPPAFRGELSFVNLVTTSRDSHEVSASTRMVYRKPKGCWTNHPMCCRQRRYIDTSTGLVYIGSSLYQSPRRHVRRSLRFKA